MKKVKKFLNNKYMLRYNIVLERPEIKEKHKNGSFELIDKYRFNSILIEINSEDISCTKDTLKTLLESSFVKKHNPFKAYIKSLPEWDGIDHIDALASTMSTKDEGYFKWIFRKWLVAMVACATIDNATNHQVLILIGAQGVGKTTWLLKLLPPILRDYVFSGNINPSNKDTTLLLSERMLIIMDELSSYTPAKVEAFKELITKEVISERRAYGYFTENYVRRASFAGSANHSQVLLDVTGNRRFLVVNVDSIDLNHTVDLDKVYAQASHLLKTGYKYYFDGEDILRIEQNNEQFRQVSPEEEYLLEYFSLATVDDPKTVSYLSASEVIEWLKKKSSYRGNLNHVKMGKILTERGFKHKKIGGLKKYILLPNSLD